ncbi:MAG TPA: hypothetical protein VIG24_02130 [Acidimicrobiia bacterium]
MALKQELIAVYLTPQEFDAALRLVDAGVRAGGLQAAVAGSVVGQKLLAAKADWERANGEQGADGDEKPPTTKAPARKGRKPAAKKPGATP